MYSTCHEEIDYNAQHGKMALMHFMGKVGPDHHLDMCSLIWAFSVCRRILQYPKIL